ncbi:cytochrome-c peroxidase [Geomesophilobacter sediminis]|uniref:Cytochrome-c peroxidase n=1 Tax=Geomesophilobacter sediminis TaxID=2798584 RepID=A0A8J7LV40_9BACT|nr:cytochrome-c peroxidase [Geomesophilobacter sediminis]MBJ6724510.1 cytochrome-c peroxidase [Geomesophilobacter sediminis]
MKRLLVPFAMMILIAANAWGGDATLAQARQLFSPVPSKAPVSKKNPATAAKLELGKMLYFDPRLSASNLISCATCHNIGMGGVDQQETSIGHGWQKGPRNAPTVLNAVFNIAQFWDGRAADLEAQAKGPVQASVEMNNKPERVVETLKSMPGYVTAFKRAFPREKDPVTFDNMARAIEVFEATLVTPGARFDKYLKGDGKALNATERKGLALFINKGCAACHSGVNVGGTGYFPFGVKESPAAEVRPVDDVGRFTVTHTASDKYVYKSPSLRNIALTPPYFHSGKVWSLDEAVKIMGSAQLGIHLAPAEEKEIVAFLKTLTGKQPQVVYPILPESSESTPRPAVK